MEALLLALGVLLYGIKIVLAAALAILAAIGAVLLLAFAVAAVIVDEINPEDWS